MDYHANVNFVGGAKISGLPAASANGEAVAFEQLQALLDGLAPKDNVRVAGQVNVNLVAPGAALNGITMSVGDRFLAFNQTDAIENGIYQWNGAAVPSTRTTDASTFDELESAKVTVDEGTSAGMTYRQTQVNGVIGTNNIVWVQDGSTAGQATTTVSGIMRLATQADVDGGTTADEAVTPETLAAWAGRPKRFSATFGDGSATQYDLTHNLGTTDIIAAVRKVSDGSVVGIDWRALDANNIRINSIPAVASNALRCTVIA